MKRSDEKLGVEAHGSTSGSIRIAGSMRGSGSVRGRTDRRKARTCAASPGRGSSPCARMSSSTAAGDNAWASLGSATPRRLRDERAQDFASFQTSTPLEDPAMS